MEEQTSMPEWWIEISPLLNLGGWLVVAAGVLIAVRSGQLVPKSTIDQWLGLMRERLDDRDRQIEEYRAALDAAHQRNEVLADSQHQLLQIGETTNEVLASISHLAQHRN